MSEGSTGWSEENSQQFLDFSEVIVPSRSEQMELVAGLVPAEQDEQFTAVDLACGAGLLSAVLLRRFPRCRVIGLDGSSAMLAQAEETLAQFEGRFELRPFGLNRRDWLEHLPADLRCFVSSLAIHHLDGPEKQQLFRDLRHRLPPGGVLLIADLVEPVNDWARSAYARAWDEAVRERSVRLVGTLEPYERFRDGWNHYVTPDVDFDKPSGLFEQLKWLEAAGFSRVDCFWLRAGHAIYGGYS